MPTRRKGALPPSLGSQLESIASTHHFNVKSWHWMGSDVVKLKADWAAAPLIASKFTSKESIATGRMDSSRERYRKTDGGEMA